ncbi:ParB/RepB/Spo0J family partition protein [Emcibacter sp. SYSU 3D8]|uniref:ParB/RepB/Spo0J family partition protein n=1 Tax=Emcibacter sp. SYSU 3D8 TaxID=3133969 RepID=UPI0031FEE0C4
MSTQLITIALSSLIRAEANVRKTATHADIGQLAASIEAHGLLENLIVTSLEDGHYAVVAGGRRLAALGLLRDQGKIEADHPVPCQVREPGEARELFELSLAENVIRAPLHPADQFEAFRDLQLQGLGAEETAARFGMPVSTVLQRLKLAAVSPRLLAEYREERMTLEQLMAFTISDDIDAQEAIWFDLPHYDRTPAYIRRLLTRSQVEGRDRRARFIGSEAYEAAGGIIARDLFQPETDGYFSDSQLLDRLVGERLAAEAEALKAEGWGWVDVCHEIDYGHLGRFGRVRPVERPLSDEEEARLSALATRYDELVSALDEDEQSDELDTVTAEMQAIQDGRVVWSEDVKANAGAVLSLDYTGALVVTRGLVRPEDRQDDVSGNKKSRRANGNGADDILSDTLMAELTAHRTAALQAVLATKPDQALNALVVAMASRLFYSLPVPCCIDVRPVPTDPSHGRDTVGASPALAELMKLTEAWSERLPDQPGDLLTWVMDADIETKLDLLAYCTARTVNAIVLPNGQANGGCIEQSHRLAESVGLDMTAWWSPTQATYFSRVTREQIGKAVGEAVSKRSAQKLAKAKTKKVMAEEAERLMAGKAWLPAPLRSSPVA